MRKIKLIIFDIDNTLIAGDLASKYYSQYPPLLEKTLARCLDIPLDKAKQIANTHRRTFNGRGEKAFETYGTGMREWYEAICSLDPRPFITESPKIQGMLRSLKDRGYSLGAITDGPVRQARRMVKLAGIDLRIFSIFIGWKKNQAMPKNGRPDVFESILLRNGLLPKQVLMVGDSIDIDIIPAKSCGINVLHVSKAGRSGFPTISSVEILPIYLNQYES